MKFTIDFLIKVFYVLFGVTLLTFVIATQVLPAEKIATYDDLDILDVQWYYIAEDGTKIDVEIPVKVDAKEGNVVVFGCELPEIEDNKALVLRASKQSIQIYIDGELRKNHVQEHGGFFTDTTISAYLYIPVNSEDSYKNLTINTQSDSSYSGVLKTVYYGEVLDMLINLCKEDFVTVIASIAVLFISVISIMVCYFVSFKLKSSISFIHLAFATLLVSIWIIAQSSLRQVLFSNVTLAGVLTFWSLMLIPIPFAIYMNQIQNKRYSFVYSIVIGFNSIVFIFANIIWIFTDVDFFELIPMIWISIGLVAITIIATSIWDLKKGLAKDYAVVLLGYIGLTICTAYQMYIYGNKTTVFSGLTLSVGLVFLLLTAGIKAFKDYGKFICEKNDLKQTIEEKDCKIEKMSTQILHSLAQAIDAKDTYTNGHSLRVAQYSLLLAKKLELSNEMQSLIYYTALLHDIGKIGIPDQILQKTTKLTDDEYNIIKTHTIIGHDILKHIEEIPEIELGARWHHEKYEGKGYPDGLKGDEIPLTARIIAVADSFDAMSSSRVYRQSLSDEYIRLEIANGLGTQFDPEIGREMLKLIDNGETEDIRNSTI